MAREIFPQLEEQFQNKLWKPESASVWDELFITAVTCLGKIHYFLSNYDQSIYYYEMVMNNVLSLIDHGEKGILKASTINTFLQYFCTLHEQAQTSIYAKTQCWEKYPKVWIKKRQKMMYKKIMPLINEDMDLSNKELLAVHGYKYLIAWKFGDYKGTIENLELCSVLQKKMALKDPKNFSSKDVNYEHHNYLMARVNALMGNQHSSLQHYLKVIESEYNNQMHTYIIGKNHPLKNI